MVCLKKQKRLASTFGILFVAEKVRSEFWMLVVMFFLPDMEKDTGFLGRISLGVKCESEKRPAIVICTSFCFQMVRVVRVSSCCFSTWVFLGIFHIHPRVAAAGKTLRPLRATGLQVIGQSSP